MGKCNECGKKIEYNHFKKYRGKILCYGCYDTRLERKRAKRKLAEEKVKEDADKLAQQITEEQNIANPAYLEDPEDSEN